MSEQKLFAGHAVRRVRRANGLTQGAMADALAISASYLNLIERNQRPLTATLLLKLAQSYDFDPRTLTGTTPGGGVEARDRGVDPTADSAEAAHCKGVDGKKAQLVLGELEDPDGLALHGESKGTDWAYSTS
jgi:transcriptional regulator with XRE-family HTH domain